MGAESFLHYPYLLVPLAIGIVLILLIAWLVLRLHGDSRRRLEKVLRRGAAEQLRDVVIPDGIGGEIHLERLLLTGAGALVLEFHDVSGTIFAGDRLEEWVVINRDGRYTFRNPLGPLQDRVTAVRLLAPELPVEGRIVFSDAGRFPKGMPAQVSLLRDLALPVESPDESYREAWESLTSQASQLESK
jgi:hypothetical protein